MRRIFKNRKLKKKKLMKKELIIFSLFIFTAISAGSAIFFLPGSRAVYDAINITIDCDKKVAYKGEHLTCQIKGVTTSSHKISSLSIKYRYQNKLSLNQDMTNSIIVNPLFGGDGLNNDLELYVKNEFLSGTFDIATLIFDVTDDLYNVDNLIELYDIHAYNDTYDDEPVTNSNVQFNLTSFRAVNNKYNLSSGYILSNKSLSDISSDIICENCTIQKYEDTKILKLIYSNNDFYELKVIDIIADGYLIDIEKGYIFTYGEKNIDDIINRLTVFNASLRKNNNNDIEIIYEDKTIKTLSILNVESDVVRIDAQNITLQSQMSYNDLINSINHNKMDLQVVDSRNNVITSGNIANNYKLRLIYNNNVIKEFTIGIINNPYMVTVNILNGKLASQSNVFQVNKNSDFSFVAVPNSGYEDANISCTNNQIISRNNNTFNVRNVTNNTTCTVGFTLAQYNITYLLNGGITNNPLAYKMTDTITLNNPTKKGYDFIGWTGSNGTVPSKDITITNSYGDKSYEAHYTIHTYNIKYETNEFGTISGQCEEFIKYNESPQAEVMVSPNSGYKLLKITVNKQVKLTDNTIIYANQKITSEQIKKIKVEDDVTIKYIFSLQSNIVKFESDSNINLLGDSEEEVGYNGTVSGLNYQANDGYTADYVTADKDVVIDDQTITKGSYIKIDDINKIQVSEATTLTIVSKVNTYNVSFVNDNNSKISTKIKTYTIKDKIDAPKYTINQGYNFDYWYSKESLKLMDGTVIVAFTKLSSDDLLKVVINKDIKLYLKTKKKDIKITFNIINGDSANNLTIDYSELMNINKFNEDTIFICDKDLELTDNTIIKANVEFNLMQLKKIKLNEDINIRVINKSKDSYFDIDNISKYYPYIGAGIIVLCYLVIDYKAKLLLFRRKNQG